MKTLLTLFLITISVSLLAQKKNVLVELFSVDGSQTQPYIDQIKANDDVIFLHWHKGKEESSGRTARRIEYGGIDQNTLIGLEGHMKLQRDSLDIYLRPLIDSLKSIEKQSSVKITYDKAAGKIRVVLSAERGCFWFISKQKGSDEPFFSTYGCLDGGLFTYDYNLMSENQETEFVVWVQGITVTSDIKRIIIPVHYWD